LSIEQGQATAEEGEQRTHRKHDEAGDADDVHELSVLPLVAALRGSGVKVGGLGGW
jgi:hypothetical protein